MKSVALKFVSTHRLSETSFGDSILSASCGFANSILLLPGNDCMELKISGCFSYRAAITHTYTSFHTEGRNNFFPKSETLVGFVYAIDSSASKLTTKEPIFTLALAVSGETVGAFESEAGSLMSGFREQYLIYSLKSSFIFFMNLRCRI